MVNLKGAKEKPLLFTDKKGDKVYRYAGVVVNSTSIQLDKIFTYKIPQELLAKIKIGNRVLVPFGMGNKKIDAFVIDLYEDIENKENIKIKSIIKVYEKFPVLSYKDMRIVEYMKKNYLSTYMEGIKTILPSMFFKGVKKKKENLIYIGKPLEGRHNKEPYINIYNIVKKNSGKFNKTALSKKFNLSLSSINTLLKYDFLTQQEKVINRYNDKAYKEYEEKVLNEEQRCAVEKIMNSSQNMFLIKGVTGSGKTEIYMNLVKEMLKQDKDSIILVPEIALTPQMIERFKGRFGKDITLFHSRLSDGEKYDEWVRVKKGEVKIAIGPRSAIFLPFNNLGLIVIDEEHETSYKSDSDPKYNAKDIGKIKSELYNCKLVLGTATPSIETYYAAKTGELELIELLNRADGAAMPKVEIVDMREELINNNRSIFSKKLFEGIEERLNKKEQIILFLNRRGFSTFVSCRKCGYVFKCSNCDIALTYHNRNSFLICHYCGKRERVLKTCPKCGSSYVKYFGAGTERIEKEVHKYFPRAKTLRMDFDTTRKKNSHERIYETFKSGKADILIGTQMIAKGLDFENVTLVGVIAADLSLNIPDYKATERTFQLITQVSGRAGRGKKEGEVIVQTYNPDNYSIIYSASNEYDKFYKEELEYRRLMDYPPFTEIMLINLSSKNEDILIKNIQNVGIILKDTLKNNDKINILGPCPCEISKIKNNYRWQITLKGIMSYELKHIIKNKVYESLKDVYSDIKVSIDINPTSLM